MELLENCDRVSFFRDRRNASNCANVHMSGGEYVADNTSVPIVSILRRTRRVEGVAAIDQGMTLSEVPHRRQFWQSIRFLVAEQTLHGFRGK